jgi:hypothetical protein
LELASIGLKGLLLANGGALVAMLTFVGNYDQQPLVIASLWLAFAMFVVGLVGTLAAIVFGYFAQGHATAASEAGAEKIFFGELRNHPQVENLKTAEELKHIASGGILRTVAIVFALLSAAAFAGGAGFGISSLTKTPSTAQSAN